MNTTSDDEDAFTPAELDAIDKIEKAELELKSATEHQAKLDECILTKTKV